MLQATSDQVWGFGRGMARTVARVTLTADGPVTEGAMVFETTAAGEWTVTLDTAGVTEIRYLAARILQGAGAPDIQAMCVVIPNTGGKQIAVSVRDMAAGNPGVAVDLPLDSALVIDVITDQTGDIEFSYGPQIPPPSLPPPVPPPRERVIL